MQWYADRNTRYVKTGYAGSFPYGLSHHGQYGVNHYQRVVETAARYRMMVDAHEPIKDTGIRRTWPNMMTREGARGVGGTRMERRKSARSPRHATLYPLIGRSHGLHTGRIHDIFVSENTSLSPAEEMERVD